MSMTIALLIILFVLVLNALTVTGGALRSRRREQALAESWAELDRFRSSRRYAG